MMNQRHNPILRHGHYDVVLRNMPPVDLIVTSPPYNLGSGGAKRYGDRKNGVYDAKSYGGITGYPDTMPEAEYQASQRVFLEWCAAHIKPNGVIAYNHKTRYRDGTGISPWSWFPPSLVVHDEIIWDRGSTHNHNQQHLYQQTERIFVFKRAAKARIYVNPRELHHSDVWRIKREFQTEKIHAAPFPLELPRRCIRLWCPPKGSVCDPYAGSGTTAVAARIEGRDFYGAERVQKYAAYARVRLRTFDVAQSQRKVA